VTVNLKKPPLPEKQVQELKVVLEGNSVFKVMYGAGPAAAALFHWQGIVIHNVFDIQVMHSQSDARPKEGITSSHLLHFCDL